MRKLSSHFWLAASALVATGSLSGRALSQQFVSAPIPALGSATEAAKFGDWDLDGDLDLIWANGGDAGLQQSRYLLNLGLAQGMAIGTYADRTATHLLPNFTQASRDVQIVDIDNDGDLDYYFSNHSDAVGQQNSNTWFINQGLAQGGTLGVYQRDMTRWVGVGVAGPGGSSVPAALNIAAGNFAGGWVDWSCQCEFADVDFDDDQDLYHSSYGPAFSQLVMSRLFLNGFNTTLGNFREYNPSGAVSGNPNLAAGSQAGFVEGTQADNTLNTAGALHDITNEALDVDFADLDNDLDHDILANSRDTISRFYQSRWNENGGSLGSEPNRLYRDVTGSWGATLQVSGSNYDADVNDMDNDNDVDGYFLNYVGGLGDGWAVNNGTGVFGPLLSVPSSGTDDNEIDWIDYDNDGDVDAFISAFITADRMYRNNFVESSSINLTLAAGIIPGVGNRNLASDIGDIDNDGDPDIIEAQDAGQNEVLARNTLNVPDPIAPRVPRTTQLVNGGPTSTPRLVVAQAYDNINFENFEQATGVLDYTVDGVPRTAAARYSGGNLWTGRIPGYWFGNIAYSLSVTDRAGNTGTSATKNVAISSAGLANYGAGTPGCNGPQVIGANSAPTIGNPDYTFTCTNAPPSSLGLVLVTDVSSPGSDPFGLGFTLLVDLIFSTQVYALDSFSNAGGLATAPAPLPNAPSAVGASLFAQHLSVWTSCSPSPLGISTSNGLQMTFLP